MLESISLFKANSISGTIQVLDKPANITINQSNIHCNMSVDSIYVEVNMEISTKKLNVNMNRIQSMEAVSQYTSAISAVLENIYSQLGSLGITVPAPVQAV